ncbi:unnamed protein product [Musa textilis]
MIAKEGNFELHENIYPILYLYFLKYNIMSCIIIDDDEIIEWDYKLLGQTVVWVANRGNPVSNASGAELRLSDDGNLVVLNSFKVPVWSSNSTPSTSNASVAVLLDTGNLVLKDGSNSSTLFWQSFDHPTDTWMPRGWLGVNKITGEYQSITSCENPAPGPSARSMDPDGSNQYVILWNGSEIYWSSGLWNGQYFTGVPGTKESTAFNFTFVDNRDRKFATYTITDSAFITRYVIDSAGQAGSGTGSTRPRNGRQSSRNH